MENAKKLMQGNVETQIFQKLQKVLTLSPWSDPLMPRYEAYAIFRATFDEFTHYLAYLCLFLISNPKLSPNLHPRL